MLQLSKVLRYIACVKYYSVNEGSNAMYVKGVQKSSIYTIRAVMPVMLCMLKVLKEVQSALTHLCS